jgi:hypothetical protein
LQKKKIIENQKKYYDLAGEIAKQENEVLKAIMARNEEVLKLQEEYLKKKKK